MGKRFSRIFKGQQPSEKMRMADGRKNFGGLEMRMTDGSKNFGDFGMRMADGRKNFGGLEMRMTDGSKNFGGFGVKPGALIEISGKGKPYEDWALCVAENEVIHVVELSPTKAIIKRGKLENVVGSDQLRVNHHLDKIYDAREIQDILENVRTFKDIEVPNNLFTNNCKHMVPNWSFGKLESRQVKPGDMIEISRKGGLYKHWALYMGENEVMHVVKTAPTKAKIKRGKLKKVVGSDQWRVNNRLDEEYVPKDTQDILEDAQKWKGRKVFYDPLTNNCEHMVTNWRYGKPESRQAEMAVSCGAWSLGVLLTVVVGTELQRKKSKKEGLQRSSTGPMEEGGETVSKEKAKSSHADTAAELTDVDPQVSEEREADE